MENKVEVDHRLAGIVEPTIIYMDSNVDFSIGIDLCNLVVDTTCHS